MSNYPDPEELQPAVVDTRSDDLVFVASRSFPGLWRPVEVAGGRYRCVCEGFQRRGGCRHTSAAWKHRPLVVAVPVHEVDDPELARYADPFDRPVFNGAPDLPQRGGVA